MYIVIKEITFFIFHRPSQITLICFLMSGGGAVIPCRPVKSALSTLSMFS